MAERLTAPVAELFALLDIDSSRFTAGLEDADVSLENFSKRVVTSKQLISEMQQLGLLTGAAFNDYSSAVELLSEQIYKNAEAHKLEQQSIEATSVSMLKQQEIRQVELASRQEYQNLVKQLATEEMQAQADLLDMYERENEEMSRIDVERLQRIEAITAAEEREALASRNRIGNFFGNFQEEDGPGGGGGGRGGGGSGGNVGFRAGPGGINPTFRITERIAAELGPLMDIIFPIALITLGIDLWERFSQSMRTGINSLTGAIDVFEQLDKATKDMLTAKEKEMDQSERIRTQARRLGISEQQLRSQIGSTVTPETREIDKLLGPLITERGNLDSIVNTLKNVPPFARGAVIQAESHTLGMTDSQDLDEKRLMQRQKDVIAEINKLTEQKVRLQTQEAESLDKGTKAHKKWHDEIHEYPNRLPWFLSAADTAFPTQGAFGATDMGGGHTVSSSFSRQAPAPHAFGPMRTPSHTSSPVTPTASRGGATISIQNTFAPHFEGLPADIQAFVRDKMEPMFLKDMDNNSRAVASQLIEKLRKWGLQ